MEPTRLAFLADAPDLTALAVGFDKAEDAPVGAEPPSSWVQLAKQGKFRHPRFGRFEVTENVYATWQRNFAEVSGGELPMDFDHTPERGGPTGACGWIKALEVRGKELWAKVEWNWEGALAIKQRRYRYISPTFARAFVSDDETKRGPALLGAALTNRPFLERMAVVSLSADFDSDALTLAAEERPEQKPDTPKECPCPDPSCEECRKAGCHRPKVDKSKPPASDSRAAMSEFAKFAEALGLSAEATEEEILTAAREAKEAAEKPAEDGQVTLSATEVADLTSKANAGEKAAADLADMRFSTAYDKAVEEGRAAPAQREHFHKIFQADEELAIATLDSLQQVVSTKASGRPGGAPSGGAPDSYSVDGLQADPDALELDAKAKALAEEKGIDYVEAYSRLFEEANA